MQRQRAIEAAQVKMLEDLIKKRAGATAAAREPLVPAKVYEQVHEQLQVLNIHTHTHTHVYIYICTYMYIEDLMQKRAGGCNGSSSLRYMSIRSRMR